MVDRMTGYAKLREGRIHLRCYSCGRKMSNVHRDEYDPPSAFLMETPCAKCASGSKDPETFYYDANGQEITPPVDDWWIEACAEMDDPTPETPSSVTR